MRRKDENIISWLDRTTTEEHWGFLKVGEEEINQAVATLKSGDRDVKEENEKMKTNEEYIFKAVDLAWRWFRTNELKNSIDSGIRCMDIDDPWIISTDDIQIGRGPGLEVLVKQLIHQTSADQSRSIDQLKELVDSGDVIPKTRSG